MGVAGYAPLRIVGDKAVGEFVHVEGSYQHGAGVAQPADRRRVVRGGELANLR